MRIKKNTYGNKRSGFFPVLLSFLCFYGCVVTSAADGVLSGWIASPESPEVTLEEEFVSFPLVFTADQDRIYWDRSFEQDWSQKDGIWVEVFFENPSAVRAVTLYVKSGEGWYTAYLSLSEGYRRSFLSFTEFESLGEPAGFQQIDGLRISPWKGEGVSGTMRFYDLVAVRTPVLCIDPDAGSSLNASEQAFGLEKSALLAAHFEEMGIAVTRLSDAEASKVNLMKYEVVVLPYNAYPSTPLLEALNSYMDKGGKLLVFYSASPELAEMCGFGLRKYLASGTDTKWNRISFSDDLWKGPDSVRMPTRNILPVSPGKDGTILGDWVDVSGRIQKESAVVRSDRAVWVSTVLPLENDEAQRQMLAGFVELLVPEMKVLHEAVWNDVNQIRRGELAERIPEDNLVGVEKLLNDDQPFQAWEALNEARAERNLDLGKEFDAPEFEMLGIWDATGQGLYNGDWDRTIDLLVSAGLTDLFLYIPRGSGTPIRVLRASEDRIDVHAWLICWNGMEMAPVTLRRYEREGRLQVSEEGEPMAWLCPSHPENVKMELRRIEELAGTKGLKGIHLDYVRWQDDRPCACGSCKKSFQNTLRKQPDWPKALRGGPQHGEFLKWRALQIDQFVKLVSSVMNDNHPHLQLSVAVWPSFKGGKDRIGQNWTYWVQRGWVDFIIPMNYTDKMDIFKTWTQSQRKEIGRKTKLITGIGFDSSTSRLRPAQVLRQVSDAALSGADGFALFKLTPAFEEELAPVLKQAYGPREKK